MILLNDKLTAFESVLNYFNYDSVFFVFAKFYLDE